MAVIAIQVCDAKISVELDLSGGAAGGGDTIVWSKNVALIINNTNGGSINVTVASHTNSSQAYDHDEVHAVGSGKLQFVDVSAERFKNPSTGVVDLTYSDVTGVFVTALKYT